MNLEKRFFKITANPLEHQEALIKYWSQIKAITRTDKILESHLTINI
jgi:hypothetical protein